MKDEKEKDDKKITLIVIVSGKSTTIDENLNAPLKSIIGKALEKTGNTGQAKENWEIKDELGNVLDGNKKIGTFAFPIGVKLFLNVAAGVGG